MQESRPSRTALRVALRRAAHQLYDARPLILDDPIAVSILGLHAEELTRTPGLDLGPRPSLKPRPSSVALRAFLVARSRYAEDLLARAVSLTPGLQYVLLGAGLDTFAHRNPHSSLRVFEVDHPATQQWKRELLATSHLPHPETLTYVPVDFEAQSLAAQLAAAGHDPSLPTFFAWLGVVPYLTLPAFRATLAFVAAQPARSGLVFDYAQPRSALPIAEQLARDSLAARVELAGEPFQLFFTPQQVAAEVALASPRFHAMEDLGTPELNTLYFDPRALLTQDKKDTLRAHGSSGHLLSAWL